MTLLILCDDRLMDLGSFRCTYLTAITDIYSSWTVNQSWTLAEWASLAMI